MFTLEIQQVARRAADRLAPEFGPHVPRDVEETLSADPLAGPAERVIEPISLGSLLVSLASLGWTMYRDMKKDRAAWEGDRATLTRRVAENLLDEARTTGRMAGLEGKHEKLIVEAVAAEISRADREGTLDPSPPPP